MVLKHKINILIVIIKKYSHVEDKYIENIEIFPKLNKNELVQSFNINGNKLYLYVKNKSNNTTSIIIYNLRNSKKVGSIIIKVEKNLSIEEIKKLLLELVEPPIKT